MKVLIANMPILREVITDLLDGKILPEKSEDLPGWLIAEIPEHQSADLQEWASEFGSYVAFPIDREAEDAEARRKMAVEVKKNSEEAALRKAEADARRDEFFARPVVESGRYSYRLKPGEKLTNRGLVRTSDSDEISVEDYVTRRWQAERWEPAEGPGYRHLHGLAGFFGDDD